MKEFRAALDDFDIIWYLALVLQFMRAFLFFAGTPGQTSHQMTSPTPLGPWSN